MSTEISFIKTDEKYLINTKYGEDRDLTIYLTVHFDTPDGQRTFSITGKHDKFEFKESDPDLIEAFARSLKEAYEIGTFKAYRKTL